MVDEELKAEDKKTFEFEVDAYDIEIAMAEDYNQFEIVERLRKLKEDRRRELLGE